MIELIASFEKIARFWQNLTFLTPCDLNFHLLKNNPFIFVELGTAYLTPFTASRCVAQFSRSYGGGGVKSTPPPVLGWLRPPPVRGLTKLLSHWLFLFRTFHLQTFSVMNFFRNELFPLRNFSIINIFRYEPFPSRTFSVTNLFRYEPFPLPTFSVTNLFSYQLNPMRTLSHTNLLRYEPFPLRTLVDTNFIRCDPLHTNLCLRTFAYEPLLTNLCLRTSAYELLLTNLCLRTFAYEPLLTNLCLRTFAYEPLLTNLCLWTFAYEPLHTNLCLRTFAYEPLLTNLFQNEPFLLRTSAYELLTWELVSVTNILQTKLIRYEPFPLRTLSHTNLLVRLPSTRYHPWHQHSTQVLDGGGGSRSGPVDTAGYLAMILGRPWPRKPVSCW